MNFNLYDVMNHWFDTMLNNFCMEEQEETTFQLNLKSLARTPSINVFEITTTLEKHGYILDYEPTTGICNVTGNIHSVHKTLSQNSRYTRHAFSQAMAEA